MSQFDNPFADPTPAQSNPFSDPSVQAARGEGAAATSGEFNPFDRTHQQQPARPLQPAMLPFGEDKTAPPPYTSSAQQRVTSEELERRQRELEARARELERREQEQQRREAEGPGAPGTDRQNNWPPLPKFCCVGPCFYQDFDLEIPAENRSLVKIGYYLWIANVILLLVNVIGALVYFIVVQASDAVTSGTVFGVSLLVCIILPPCTFICWFRPLYKAFKNDSSLNFFLYFLVFFINVCVLIVQCLGVNYLGSCGWINAFATLKSNIGAGAFMMVIAALFSALAVAEIVLIVRVYRVFRSSGSSFAKARQELRSNEAVRGAAASAAATTFTALSSSGGGGGSGAGGGRY